MERDKENLDLNWEDFQNNKKIFKNLLPILKVVGKYKDITIADMISRYKQDILSRDQLKLSAMNVYLAVEAGKAEAAFTRTHGEITTRTAEAFVNIKKDHSEESRKMTDSLAHEMSEVRISKYRERESRAQEKSLVLNNVMYRVAKLLDALESAIKSLKKEGDKYT
jgi:hypothetical protein